MKLAGALVVPLAALVVVTGLEVADSMAAADEVHTQADLATRAAGPPSVLSLIEDERNAAAIHLLDAADLVALPVEDVTETRVATDEALATFREDIAAGGRQVEAAYGPALEALGGIEAIRTQVDQAPGTRGFGNVEQAIGAFDAYSVVMDDMFRANLHVTPAIGDTELRRGAELIDLTARQTDLIARIVRHLLVVTITGDNRLNQAPEVTDISRLLGLVRSNEVLISTKSRGQYAPLAEDLLADPDIQRFPELVAEAVETGSVPIEDILTASTGTDPSRYGYTVFRQEVDETLQAEARIVQRTADSHLRRYLILAVLATLVAVVVTWLVSRSITRPLRALTLQAKEMSTDRLPSVVFQILETPLGDDVQVPETQPITVRTRDEVGDVATALNTVQDAAVELAVEQAVLRRNIADSFVNLGRRNQNLLGRQLDFITELESNETHPDTLASLFRLDHLATRMRRNAESLLVLAGIEPPRKWAAPVRLADVIRAALGEVEDYQRVTIRNVEPATILGSVAADLAHLCAEFIENALTFSPPDQDVEVRGRGRPDGYTLAVIDNGFGMSADDLDQANRRLAGGESFTIAPSKYLGHYVAGNLAARHGILLRLGPTPGHGVTATIELPSTLLTADHAVPDSTPAHPREANAHAAMAAAGAADAARTGDIAAGRAPAARQPDGDTDAPFALPSAPAGPAQGTSVFAPDPVGDAPSSSTPAPASAPTGGGDTPSGGPGSLPHGGTPDGTPLAPAASLGADAPAAPFGDPAGDMPRRSGLADGGDYGAPYTPGAGSPVAPGSPAPFGRTGTPGGVPGAGTPGRPETPADTGGADRGRGVPGTPGGTLGSPTGPGDWSGTGAGRTGRPENAAPLAPAARGGSPSPPEGRSGMPSPGDWYFAAPPGGTPGRGGAGGMSGEPGRQSPLDASGPLPALGSPAGAGTAAPAGSGGWASLLGGARRGTDTPGTADRGADRGEGSDSDAGPGSLGVPGTGGAGSGGPGQRGGDAGAAGPEDGLPSFPAGAGIAGLASVSSARRSGENPNVRSDSARTASGLTKRARRGDGEPGQVVNVPSDDLLASLSRHTANLQSASGRHRAVDAGGSGGPAQSRPGQGWGRGPAGAPTGSTPAIPTRYGPDTAAPRAPGNWAPGQSGSGWPGGDPGSGPAGPGASGWPGRDPGRGPADEPTTGAVRRTPGPYQGDPNRPADDGRGWPAGAVTARDGGPIGPGRPADPGGSGRPGGSSGPPALDDPAGAGGPPPGAWGAGSPAGPAAGIPAGQGGPVDAGRGAWGRNDLSEPAGPGAGRGPGGAGAAAGPAGGAGRGGPGAWGGPEGPGADAYGRAGGPGGGAGAGGYPTGGRGYGRPAGGPMAPPVGGPPPAPGVPGTITVRPGLLDAPGGGPAGAPAGARGGSTHAGAPGGAPGGGGGDAHDDFWSEADAAGGRGDVFGRDEAGGTTSGGLTRRVRGAQMPNRKAPRLQRRSQDASDTAEEAPEGSPADASDVYGFLSSFTAGVQRGLDDARSREEGSSDRP
ncbi:MAG TPA: nitrate- and nitrite sensing domain-containing protein [Acidimicrobiales bacterium]|nr:nitrate- and nitrite sensing domain-containing protein [Acidimicrobiales bacterium]